MTSKSHLRLHLPPRPTAATLDPVLRKARSGGILTRADTQILLAAGHHKEITQAQVEGRIDWESARTPTGGDAA